MVSPQPRPPALQVEDLSVTIGGSAILRDVGLEVRAGQWLGLIGPNGAGKSTLLRAMAGLVAHTGDVRVADGRRPRPTDVALMPQAPTMPPGMTVVEYVLLGRTAHMRWLQQESRRDRVVAVDVLRRLDLTGFAHRHVDSLSGGERQRVVVARALAQQAPVLLLDEPTSALDLGHQTEVLELLEELRRREGLTIVTALHDLGAAARYADRLLLLHRGAVVRIAEPRRVLDPALLSEVYETRLGVHVLDGQLVVVPASPAPAAGPATGPAAGTAAGTATGTAATATPQSRQHHVRRPGRVPDHRATTNSEEPA